MPNHNINKHLAIVLTALLIAVFLVSLTQYIRKKDAEYISFFQEMSEIDFIAMNCNELKSEPEGTRIFYAPPTPSSFQLISVYRTKWLDHYAIVKFGIPPSIYYICKTP